MRYRLLSPLLLMFALLCSSEGAAGQKVLGQKFESAGKMCPYIVSPGHPTDSLGETVYEVQGDDQKDIPAAPGVCKQVKLVKQVLPKFPKSLLQAKESADVTVTCIISASGSVLDAKANDDASGDAAKSAVDAVMQYKYEPATLDGKPIAEIIKVQVHFGLRKYIFSKKEYPTAKP